MSRPTLLALENVSKTFRRSGGAVVAAVRGDPERLGTSSSTLCVRDWSTRLASIVGAAPRRTCAERMTSWLGLILCFNWLPTGAVY